MKELKKYIYKVEGRNGYYAIDRYMEGSTSCNNVESGLRKKDAESLAIQIGSEIYEFCKLNGIENGLVDEGEIRADERRKERERAQDNGFTDHATALMGLWLFNSRRDLERFAEKAREFYAAARTDDKYFSKAEFATLRMREYLIFKLEEPIERFGKRDWSGYMYSLMRSGFDSADWYQIASRFIDTIIENEGGQSPDDLATRAAELGNALSVSVKEDKQ